MMNLRAVQEQVGGATRRGSLLMNEIAKKAVIDDALEQRAKGKTLPSISDIPLLD